jgi:hypothetical protein
MIFNQTTDDWQGVIQATDEQAVTVEELSTMTGCLTDGAHEHGCQEIL